MTGEKKYLVSKTTLILFSIAAFYVVSFFIDVRGGYRSGDELGFLTGFSDRNASDEFDLRYFFWVLYIKLFSYISPALPLVINCLILICLYNKLVKYEAVSRYLAFILLCLPTIFYFLNSYLRDAVFLIYTVAVLTYIITSEGKNKFLNFAMMLGFFIVFFMRPIYGAIIAISYLLSNKIFYKYFKLMLVGIVLVFVTSAILILMNDEIYHLYKDFFVYGHLRHKQELGTMMISLDEFNQRNASINFISSFLFFWFLPGSGFGERYDLLLYIENLFLLLIFIKGCILLSSSKVRKKREYRFAWIMLCASMFFAAVTTNHNDSYRFRLFFIPCLIIVASYPKLQRNYILAKQ